MNQNAGKSTPESQRIEALEAEVAALRRDVASLKRQLVPAHQEFEIKKLAREWMKNMERKQ